MRDILEKYRNLTRLKKYEISVATRFQNQQSNATLKKDVLKMIKSTQKERKKDLVLQIRKMLNVLKNVYHDNLHKRKLKVRVEFFELPSTFEKVLGQ